MITQVWNWIVDNLELILAVIGFVIAMYEIRRTKSAVEASRIATEQTLQLLSDRSTISDIALIRSGLREIQIALRGERYEAALMGIQNVRTKFHELRNRKGFTSEQRLTEIQEIIFALKKIEYSLERKLDNPDIVLSIPRANTKLSDFITQASEWNEKMRFVKRSD